MPPPKRHASAPISGTSDVEPVNRMSQVRSAKRDEGFAKRFRSALNQRGQAWLAEQTGLSTSTIHDYAQGAIPSADRVFLIADALGISARWLVTGLETYAPDASDGNWVMLPHYDLEGTIFPDEPKLLDEIPISRDWLLQVVGRTEGLWYSTMPSDYLPTIARLHDPIICEAPNGLPEDGGIYVIKIGHEWPEVKRVGIVKDGFLLKAAYERAQPILVQAEDFNRRTRIMGRLLASFRAVP